MNLDQYIDINTLTFNFSGKRFNQLNFEAFKNLLLSHPEIRQLNLSGVDLDNDSFKLVAEIIPSTNIETLIVNLNCITDEVDTIAFRNLAHSKVTSLDLGCNYLDNKGVKKLPTELLAKLNYINLSQNNIEDDGIIALVDNLITDTVINIDISSNYIQARGFEYFFRNTSALIESLNISSNKDVPWDALSDFIIKSKSLKYIYLSSLKVNGQSLKLLNDSIARSNLIQLDLQLNKIDDNALIEFSSALPTSQLRMLNLSANDITDEGVTCLSKVILESKLESLDLSYNEIGINGYKELKKCCATNNLQIKLDKNAFNETSYFDQFSLFNVEVNQPQSSSTNINQLRNSK